jgi:hypothetical protein
MRAENDFEEPGGNLVVLFVGEIGDEGDRAVPGLRPEVAPSLGRCIPLATKTGADDRSNPRPYEPIRDPTFLGLINQETSGDHHLIFGAGCRIV